MKIMFYSLFLIFNIIFSFCLAIENNINGSEIDSLKLSNSHLFNAIGLKDNRPVNKDLFQIIKTKLDSSEISLKKKIKIIEKINTQLVDGYEWSGGEAGFQNFINDNKIILLSILSKKNIQVNGKTIQNIEEVSKTNIIINSSEENNKIRSSREPSFKKINDDSKILGKETSIQSKKKKEKKVKKKKKSKYMGFELSPGINYQVLNNLKDNNSTDNIQLIFKIKYLIKTTLFTMPVSPSFGINNYSFLSSEDSLLFSGYSYRFNSDFDLSRIIRIGGDKFQKGFTIGLHGNGLGYGLTGGVILERRIGSTPLSVVMETTLDIFDTELIGLSYWGLVGLHLKYSLSK